MADRMPQPPQQQPQGQPGPPNRLWMLLLGLVAAWLLVTTLFQSFDQMGAMAISYTKFKQEVSRGNVVEVTVKGDHITGTFKEGLEGPQGMPQKRFSTTKPAFQDPKLMPLLEEHNVTINAEPQQDAWWTSLLIALLPWVLIIGLFLYANKKMQERMGGMGGQIFGFGKSKAKRYEKREAKERFDDVAGLKNAKKDLQEIIEYLKDPSKFRELGAQLPKGMLMVGPPGSGKTLLARAAAGEAGVPFFSISGSEFIEMFVGVGASRVRDLFENAKKEAPAIIFVDELDSIGRARGTGLGGGHDEREQTLNQILSEMDGFQPHEAVVVLAATNRPDVLDQALTRPGRFDRQVTIDLPDRKARQEILKIHTRKVPLRQDVTLADIAGRTVGFSGADLQNLVNEAALFAGRKGKQDVGMEEFELARDKIILGSEREDMISEEEKQVIAHHEAGHTLVARLLPGTDPLKKVSIIPRGRALGATEQMPSEDRHNLSRDYLLKRIAIMMGGRVAEQLVFKDFTTGAGDDLKQATQLAKRMVCQWGMSEKVGPVTFRQGEEHVFLGREIAQEKDFSEHTARIIDEEVQEIVTTMQKKAEEILTKNREKLDKLAQALIEHESLDSKEIDELLGFESSAQTT